MNMALKKKYLRTREKGDLFFCEKTMGDFKWISDNVIIFLIPEGVGG